jgi:MSHA biogenesis protein MshG
VIPAFAKVYKSSHADLPLMTQILVGFSQWTLAMVAFPAGRHRTRFPCLALVETHTVHGRYVWDRWLLKTPIAGKIVHKAALGALRQGTGDDLPERRAHRARPDQCRPGCR